MAYFAHEIGHVLDTLNGMFHTRAQYGKNGYEVVASGTRQSHSKKCAGILKSRWKNYGEPPKSRWKKCTSPQESRWKKVYLLPDNTS